MLLAIDAGNTNIVFALLEGGEIRQQWRLETDDARPADAYQSWLREALEGAGVTATGVDGVIIASVVPNALPPLRTLSVDLFGITPLVIGEEGADLGIEVRITTPGDVGADRLVNAVAAHDQVTGKCIVVDFGTATTFDVVGADGAYLGGVISPGINLSLQALYEAAAKLPLIEIREPDNGRVTGGSTEEAMQSGIFWGYVGLIEGLVTRLKAEHGGIDHVIATGGLAGIFADHTEAIGTVDRDLTIKGLKLIHERNRP
jgi:type III pantothenate kinase